MNDPVELADVIRGGRRLVVFLHDNPDPDAIASGWLLKAIAEHLGVPARVVYGGRLGRAENRFMVNLLKIPIEPLRDGGIRYRESDRYALVDTQPGTGNNSFPDQRLKSHIVIDHHPRRDHYPADFTDIRPDTGCCTTILLERFFHDGIPMEGNLATACAYAIISETQDLGREATQQDRNMFLRVFPHARQRLLGKIRHPPRTRDYYHTVARAMRHVMVSRNTCVCHAGRVSSPEMVAELSDFLVSMERVTWCLVSGFTPKEMLVSLRTTNPEGQAHDLVKKIVGDRGSGGGHGMVAGGQLPCAGGESYTENATRITEAFMKSLGRQGESLRRLIGEREDFSVENRISKSIGKPADS